mmetsp:Transcript_27982/g.44861  ORF Transcript_27982/g.44861 Transcript_27982/m.44861 type:complete len:80 (+) Transcript_27982:50-289(+)
MLRSRSRLLAIDCNPDTGGFAVKKREMIRKMRLDRDWQLATCKRRDLVPDASSYTAVENDGFIDGGLLLAISGSLDQII